jgi:hypothetical protein
MTGVLSVIRLCGLQCVRGGQFVWPTVYISLVSCLGLDEN